MGGAMLRFWVLCLLALGLVTLATGFSEEQNIAKLGQSDMSKDDIEGNVRNIRDVSGNKIRKQKDQDKLKKKDKKKKKNNNDERVKGRRKNKESERKKKKGKKSKKGLKDKNSQRDKEDKK